MKTDPSLLTIPVIVLSGSSACEDIKRAYRHGCNAYVIKPGSPDKLRLFAKTLDAFWFTLGRVPKG